MKHILISRNYEWVRDFIDEVSPFIPELTRVTRITFRKARKDRPTRVGGTCSKLYKGEFRITIHTHYTKVTLEPVRLEQKEDSILGILELLAHEIAHLRHWKHGPNHKYLECAILGVFLKLLEKQGYDCEENEQHFKRKIAQSMNRNK